MQPVKFARLLLLIAIRTGEDQRHCTGKEDMSLLHHANLSAEEKRAAINGELGRVHAI